jgi:formylglycine-generating enzyme required for sulfatase activity
MNSLYSAKNKLNIVVLDACRNDPFKNAFGRSATDNGLGQILAPTGTLIAYSTSPEKTAEDGSGQRNSPYTRHLLNSLRIPDLKLGDVFKTTRIGVMKDTGGRQVPWENSSIIGDFYFIGQGNSIQVNPVSLSNPVKQQASLTINTSPTGATVFLNGGYLGLSPQTVKGLNTRKAYQLEARQQGYDSVTESVRLQSGKLSSITLVLSAPGTHLTVVTEPDNARVRILNIRPSYQDGINLTPGRYHLEVSAEGYQTQTPWVDISGGNHHEAITLEKTSFSESGLGFKWATIPSGSYLRGSKNYSDKQQLKRVSIASFKLLKYEVTQKQWQAVMGTNPSKFKDCGANCPVEQVSWDDIQTFIQKLNQRTGQYYRLPSEAEWEYAARAGSTTDYSWGNEIGHNNANCKGCGSRWDDKSTAPVDSFAPNKFGLYNMHGNVREWTQDCWNESYEGAPVNGEAWETGDCAKRVLRGGSWYYESYKLRSVKRSRNTASERSYDDGFRLVQGR